MADTPHGASLASPLEHPPKPATQPALSNPVWLLGAAVFCTWEAQRGFLTILHPAAVQAHDRDPILILGMMYATFVTTSIAIRSPFFRDRAVFGSAALAMALRLIVRVLLPNRPISIAIDWLVLLLWAAAAACSFVTLVTSRHYVRQKMYVLLGLTKPEVRRMRSPLPGRVVLLVVVFSFLISWAFDGAGRFDLALPALFSAAMILLVVYVRWPLRRFRWFWITMAIFAILHVAVISSTRWTTEWVPAAVLNGLGVVDLLAMFAVLAVIANLMEHATTDTGADKETSQ